MTKVKPFPQYMRLSPKQKRIYELHRCAWENGSWDYVRPLSIPKMIDALEKEDAYKPVWDYCFGAMSFHSMKEVETQRNLTKRGSLAIRARMKEMLNKLGIR